METILEKAEGRISYHDSVEEMLKKIREDGLSNAFDRYALQEKIRCKFCLEGLSCQLCSDGPCRISEKGGQDKGVCGIGPDAMAMRTLLLHNIMGAGTYSHMKHSEPCGKPLREKHASRLQTLKSSNGCVIWSVSTQIRMRIIWRKNWRIC